jgi:hypothetical protein
MTSAADASFARVGRYGRNRTHPIEIIMPCEAGRISIGYSAIPK